MCSRVPLVLLAMICLFPAVSRGKPDNGGFEIPDPNRATQWFTPPLHWYWENDAIVDGNLNYVGMCFEFIPVPEPNQAIAWTIPSSAEGNTFVLLSTGDAEGPGSDYKTKYSSIEQIISVNPGDVLYGSYFFGTCDYSPYNDTGIVKAIPVDPNNFVDPNEIGIVFTSVNILGNYRSTNGWQDFQCTFKESGEYILYCEVRDSRDRIYKSYLALDNFRMCKAAPGFGDLNHDCDIDFLDFNILSQAWLADCNDPNVKNDPNIPCKLVIQDPNVSDNFIDTDHLLPLSENWLEWFGYPE